jgi:hypothetical protein
MAYYPQTFKTNVKGLAIQKSLMIDEDTIDITGLKALPTSNIRENAKLQYDNTEIIAYVDQIEVIPATPGDWVSRGIPGVSKYLGERSRLGNVHAHSKKKR